MSKNTETAVQAPAETVAQPAEFALTLDEFCARLSGKDRRVEMIGGFHFAEKQAGRLKDTEAAFAARYAAFQTQPA